MGGGPLLLVNQASRLLLSFSLLLSFPGRFRRVVGTLPEEGAAVGFLQQKLISSSPSRAHNPSAAQALYTASMRASGVEGGLPGVGLGCRTPFPATSAHEGAMVGGGKELDRPPCISPR